MTVLYTKNN